MTAKKRDQRHHDLVQQYLPGLILNTILGIIPRAWRPVRCQARPGWHGSVPAWRHGDRQQEQGGRAIPVRRVAVCCPDSGRIDGGAQILAEAKDAFEETYRRNSMMEPVFSSFKCRFTAVIRAKALPTQRLLLRCVCYNLPSWCDDAKNA